MKDGPERLTRFFPRARSGYNVGCDVTARSPYWSPLQIVLFMFTAFILRFRFVFVLGCSVIGSVSVYGETGTPTTPPKLEDSFVYKTADHQGQSRELRIDWTRPADWKASDHRAAVMFFHGGGWVSGKPGQFASHSVELADLGVVCFRVEYRLLNGKDKLPPDTCLADVSDAIRYVRGAADRFGIDPNRLACGGGSAGGHLAAFLGLMDDEVVDGISRKPNALLLFNPVFDNGPDQWGHARVGDAYQQYSPAHNITPDDPASIVFLGEKDSLVPVSTAERFQRLSQEAGLRSDLHTYPDQPHGFFNVKVADGKYYRDTLGKSIAFLEDLGWFE